MIKLGFRINLAARWNIQAAKNSESKKLIETMIDTVEWRRTLQLILMFLNKLLKYQLII